MALQGFVDESGSGRGGATDGNIYVLAGFLSTEKRWERFSDRWKAYSSEDPKTPDFHMADAFRMKGSRKWKDEPQRDEKINGFVDLIKAHAMYRVDSVLAWPNYEKVIQGCVPDSIDNPYFLLFFNVILSTVAFMDKTGLDETIDWVFDEQGTIGRAALQWYDYISRTVPSLNRRLGSSPMLRHDNQVLPLKAADIYAWQVRRYLDRDSLRGLPHNDYIDSLLGIHGVSNVIEGEHMEDFVKSIGHGLNLKSQAHYFLPLPKESHENES